MLRCCTWRYITRHFITHISGRVLWLDRHIWNKFNRLIVLNLFSRLSNSPYHLQMTCDFDTFTILPWIFRSLTCVLVGREIWSNYITCTTYILRLHLVLGEAFASNSTGITIMSKTCLCLPKLKRRIILALSLKDMMSTPSSKCYVLHVGPPSSSHAHKKVRPSSSYS